MLNSLPIFATQPHPQLSLKEYTFPKIPHNSKATTVPHEDVIEVGLERFVADLDGEDVSALSDGMRNHGQKLIEALEEGLDNSVPPFDRLRKLRLSGEARMILNMGLTKYHELIPD